MECIAISLRKFSIDLSVEDTNALEFEVDATIVVSEGCEALAVTCDAVADVDDAGITWVKLEVELAVVVVVVVVVVVAAAVEEQEGGVLFSEFAGVVVLLTSSLLISLLANRFDAIRRTY